MSRKKVLLGHLNSNGDCLFATIIARQIKEVDYPNCHLTWAVNSKCKQSVMLNPYVDDIWEIPTEKTLTTEQEWHTFVAEAENRRKKGDFNFVFLTQIIDDNWFNYDGGIRSSIYNNYPHKITVPHQPIIRLSDAEIENVRQFAEKHELDKYKEVILIECGPDSFTAEINSQSAYQLALDVTLGNNDVAVILSSTQQIESSRPNIIDASTLSFRENAELTKYCTLFVGCASGISWLTTTDWAKKLNMILDIIVLQNHAVFPSMIYDHEYLNLPTNHIIEIKSNRNSMKKLKDCINQIPIKGFADTRKSFNETIKLSNYYFLKYQLESTFVKLDFKKFFSSLGRYIERNGIQLLFSKEFIKIILNFPLIVINKLLKISGLKRKGIN